MKKNFITIIFFLTCGFAISQENEFSLGVVGSYDNYSLQALESFGSNVYTFDIISAYALGIDFRHQTTNQLFIESGLLYTEKGYKVDYHFIFIDPNDPFLPKKSTVKLKCLGVPIMLGYNIKKSDKLNFYTSVGFLNEIVFDISETSTFEDDSIKESNNVSKKIAKFFLSAQLNFGFGYQFNDKVELNISPYVRYGLNKISNDLMEFNPLSYGGLIGLNYKF
ncbi:MAG: hypothetical protein KFKLKKLM_02081 [Flavobacteriales bacterium]|nr:hypothetical protein [Flavobacteriales bacterium]